MSQQTPTQLTLIMRQGPHPNQAFPLHKDTLTLGRAADNDIVISEEEVSRYHARLTRQGDVWVLEDLKSRNGTFVGGQRITGPVVLTPDSQVSLGPNVLLELAVGPVAPAPPQAHPPAQPASQLASTATTAVATARGGGSTIWLVLGGIISVVVLAAIAAGLAYVVLKKPSLEPLVAGVIQTGEPGAATRRIAPPDEDALIQLSSFSGPDIAFLEPGPGTELEVGESVLVFATARDPGGVALVELYVDDYLVVQQGSPDEDGVTPLTLIHNLTAIAPGTHALTVRAYNSLGQTGDSPIIYVRVFDRDTGTAQYAVQPGESLALLAQDLGTTEEAIRQVNPGLGSSISANQVITVPVPQQPYEPPQLSISAGPTAEAPPQDKPQAGFFGDEPPPKAPQSGFSGGKGSQDKPQQPESAGGASLAAEPQAINLNPPHPDLPTPPSPRMQGLLASVQMGEIPGLIPMGAVQDPGGFKGPAIDAIVNPVSGAQNPLAQDPQGGRMQELKKLLPPPNESLPRPELLEAKAHDCMVTLKWKKQKTEATHFYIYRMALPASNSFQGVTKLDSTTVREHDDKVPRPGKYTYFVRAVIEDKGKPTAWESSNHKDVFVPVTAACVTDASYKRVYFRPFVLQGPGRLSACLFVSVNRGASLRVPPYPVDAYPGDLTWVNTVSIPAPPSFYIERQDPVLYYEVSIDGRLEGEEQYWIFNNSYPISQLDAERKHYYTGPSKGRSGTIRLLYQIWVDDVMWSSREQNDELPAPTNLSLNSERDVLSWDWKGNYRDQTGYIVYRFFNCPGQPSKLAAPQAVGDEQVRIPAHNQFPGCVTSYQVSAYGPKGESPLSEPLELEATPGLARLRVTFNTLKINHKDGKDFGLYLYANGYLLESDLARLNKGEDELKLKEVMFDGKTNNNSLLIDIVKNENLQVGLYHWGPTASFSLPPPQGQTWLEFTSGRYTLNGKFIGGTEFALTFEVKGEGPPPAGQEIVTADVALKMAVCGSKTDVSALCAVLTNYGPDPISRSKITLRWTWLNDRDKPTWRSRTYSYQPTISIPVDGQQWVKIIDVDEKSDSWKIPDLPKELEVEYSPYLDSGLRDPDSGNNSRTGTVYP